MWETVAGSGVSWQARTCFSCLDPTAGVNLKNFIEEAS